MRISSCRSPRLLQAATAILVGLAAPAKAENVGNASAVNTKSISTPPGAATRTIEIGAQVVRNEKIETSGTGSVQLLFIDKTTLNIGVNSRIVIDKFVFNPASNEGEVALNLTKGLLRVVGGQATHTGGATITTPAAAIGVRGGIVTISHSKAKGTMAILGFGTMTVTNFCSARTTQSSGCTPQTVTVRRPGFAVQVSGPDATPTEPARVSAAQLDSTSLQLTSRPGQSGGASTIPNDPLAASYNVGTSNSAAAPAVALANNAGNNLWENLISTQRFIGQIIQQGVPPAVAVTTAESVLTPPSPPAPIAAYAIVTQGPYSTSAGSSPIPYLTASYAGTGNFTVSPILGYQEGGLTGSGATNVESRQFQAGLSVAGQGAAQTSTLFVMTSNINKAPNIGLTQAGGVSVVTYQPELNSVGYHASLEIGSATPTSAPNSVPANSFGEPNGSYTINNSSINLVTGSVSNATSTDFPSGTYTFNPITTGTPTQLTANHPVLNLQGNGGGISLKGYVGGLMQSAFISPINPTNFATYSAPYIVTNATGNPGDVSITLPATSSQMGATLNIASLNAPASGLASASYQFGSYSSADPTNAAGRNTARGAYVDPANFAGRAAVIFNNGANAPISTRNGQSLAGVGSFDDSLLVTATPVGANSSTFLSSISSTTVTPCACEFTQWGFWSSLSGQSLDNGQSRFVDGTSVPALWVAGVPTTAANLPTTGTATYTGHAIADISSNGAQYLAAGTFANTVNFGTATGAVTINGLDGTNYAGNVSLKPSTTLFAGNLIGNVGGRSAALNGSFFQGGPTNTTPLYGEMGGNLTLTGANYLGSGIFLGRKP
jgi:hypothetical protein